MGNYCFCDHSLIGARINFWIRWGRVTHICVSKITTIGPDNGLSASSNYLNQCWNIYNWTLRNKLQLSFYRNSNICVQENTFENVVCKMLSISFRLQCVNSSDASTVIFRGNRVMVSNAIMETIYLISLRRSRDICMQCDFPGPSLCIKCGSAVSTEGPRDVIKRRFC